MAMTWFEWRRSQADGARQAVDAGNTRPMIELLAGSVAYVVLLPWVGFLIATAWFASLLVWRMRAVWWRAVAAALLLSFVAHGLFALLFKVPLPAGAWN
jgi:hypothetical protein